MRSQFGGTFIVELLVAILVASIMGGALITSMSDSLRVSTKAQNQVMAAAIAQQVIDACRNRDFNDLTTASPAGCMGSNQQLVLSGGAGTSYPSVFPRALVMDYSAGSYSWDQRSINGVFRGTVSVDVVPANADNVDVTVNVRWNEGTGGQRQFRLASRITRFGLRNK